MKALAALILAALSFAGDVPPQDKAALDQLIKALKAGDRAAVSQLITYPIARTQPLAPIKSKDELVKSYDDFFDEKTIAKIIAAAAKPWSNWEGTSIEGGLVWISKGRIVTINIATDTQARKAAEAATSEKAQLHPSVADYDKVLLECATVKFHIRIYDKEGRIYYASWLDGVALKHAPDIRLIGTQTIEGSAGNRSFFFRNANYSYQIDDPRVCADACETKLTVYKGQEILRTELCKKLR